MIYTISKSLEAQEKTQDIKQSLSTKIGTKPHARSQRNELTEVIGRCQCQVTCHRTRLVAVSPLWNLFVLDRTLLSYVRSTCRQHPVMLVAEPLDRSVRSLSSNIRSSVQSLPWACFFTVLHTAWFLSSCLNFAWYLGSSLVLLRSCLWCWSSDHHVAFVQVTSCILLNYKTITCKFISPIWLCWSSNTKIQS